jgi:hypothetical protein
MSLGMEGIRRKQYATEEMLSLQIKKSDSEAGRDSFNTEGNDLLGKAKKNEEDEATPRIDIGEIKQPAALDSFLFEDQTSPHMNENSLNSDSNRSEERKNVTVNKTETVRRTTKSMRFDRSAAEPEIDTHYLKNRCRFGLIDDVKETSEKKRDSNQIDSSKVYNSEVSLPPEIIVANPSLHTHKSDKAFPQKKIHGISMIPGEESKMTLMKNATDRLLHLKLSEERTLSADSRQRVSRRREERIPRRRDRKHKSKVIIQQLDPNSQEAREYQEYIPNEEEMKLRQALLAYEKTKKQKTITKNENENTTDDKSKSIEDEEGEEGDKEKKVRAKEVKAKGINIEDNQDAESSMTSSSIRSTTRSYYTLRAAIDEKYVPKSIHNIGYLVVLVFLLLLATSIVFFVLQYVLYNNLNTNIQDVRYSETRIDKLIDLASSVSELTVFNADYWQHKEDPTLEPTNSFIYFEGEMIAQRYSFCVGMLKDQAIALKDTQTNLSLKSATFSKETLAKINPSNIELLYMDKPGQPVAYNYTIWQAIMEIVVSGYRIAAMEMSQVNHIYNPTVYFVVTNALNNVLINLENSSDAVLDEIEKSRKKKLKMFVILLCAASGIILISTALLIPILRKIKTNKQEVLELFMYIQRKQAHKELANCRKFLSSIQANQDTEFNAVEGEDVQQEEEDPEAQEIAKKLGTSDGYRLSKKQSKKLVLNLGLLIFVFFFLIFIMEGYFILDYFLSATFLSHVSSLTRELSFLFFRLSTDSLAIASLRYLE